jgi:hypothetical protein
MPPSADDLPEKTPPAPRPERGGGKRKQGKQSGAAGAHLAWSEDPDDTKPLFPQGALRALIHAANTARDKGLAAVLDDVMAADLVLFRNAVRVGLSEVRPVSGAKASRNPAACCWNASRTARLTCCGSWATCGSRPPPGQTMLQPVAENYSPSHGVS